MVQQLYNAKKSGADVTFVGFNLNHRLVTLKTNAVDVTDITVPLSFGKTNLQIPQSQIPRYRGASSYDVTDF